MIRSFALLSLTTFAIAAVPAASSAQTIAPAAPSPAPSATPAPDICSTGLSSVVSRPTQTTAACVVKTAQVLIETGFQTQTVDAGSTSASYTSTSVPNATLRIGTPLRNVEFDLIPPTALHAGGTGATSDSGIGARWQIGSTPSFAYSVNAIATFATGSNPAVSPYGLGSAEAGTFVANLNAQGAINSVLGYGATFEVAQLNAGGVRYTSLVPSLDLTASLPASFGLAVEGYTQSHGEGPGTPTHTWFDAALTKDAGNAQFDLNYGVSNRIVPAPGVPGVQRHYAGFGISYLF